eukprot:g7019.t1
MSRGYGHGPYYGKGKAGKGGYHQNHDNGEGAWAFRPQITVNSLRAGETVDVFHRYRQDPNGYFMVQHRTSGVLHPSVGKTDGWTTARVNANWDAQYYNPHDYQTWVEIQWTHPLWYNRRGHRLDVKNPSMVTQRVMPEQQPVNPVTEGAGGWGATGSNPSDNYINAWEDVVFRMLGPNYEIVSAFIQNSDELGKLAPALLRHLLKGQHVAACYFMWPIAFQDGHEFPAYVQREKLIELMVQMEAAGIPSRFPHESHLYKIFASKDREKTPIWQESQAHWTAQMCLHPLLKVPLTTMVARQAVASDPAKAAIDAMQALKNLADARASWNRQLGQPEKPYPNKGVAKLGWSWEAMDVQAWRNKQELERALVSLVEQPGSMVDQIFVQEWYDRQTAINMTFQSDEAAMADAEKQAEELVGRWLQWLQAQTHTMPTVVRMDIMARRLGPGKAAIATGELTELGGCFLGWPQGPQTVFSAMLRSCFKNTAALAPY